MIHLILGFAAAAVCDSPACNPTGCVGHVSDTLVYSINTALIGSGNASSIQAGANAWDAGASKANRGAEWNFVRGSDVSVNGTLVDNVNTVGALTAAEWQAANLPSNWIAATKWSANTSCEVKEFDIAFKSSVNWSNNAPSNVSSGFSIGQTAAHEFGHAIGLDHETSVLATMNPVYPFGGDFNGEPYRIGEDDYVGLTMVTDPGTSTGINLMLSRFEQLSSLLGTSREVWTDDSLVESGKYWSACPGDTISAVNGPSAIAAHIVGTNGTITEVEWRLNLSGGCSSGDEIEIGDLAVTMTVGSPTIVSPGGSGYVIPGYTPPGSYTLCAVIDPTSSISETVETDNHIKSEKTFTVESCP